jgi:hypothetical protein
MQVKQLAAGTERTFAVVLDPGDEVVASLLAFARDHGVTSGRLTGIGAFSDAVLGFFDLARQDYERIPVKQQVEVLALLGVFATLADEVKLHAHVVLGRRDGSALGGHLLEARVRPTLEVLVEDSPAHLRRAIDPATGLPLLQL